MSATAYRMVLDLRPDETPGRTTTCMLAIYLDDDIVWPVRGENDARVEIQIDNLLAHLTEFWKPLLLRQVYPIDVRPWRPSDLRKAAELRWAGLPAATVEAEEDAVICFEDAHDLSRAFSGIYGLPPFWMLRSGGSFVLESSDRLWCLPFGDLRGALAMTGDWICRRLALDDQERWVEAIQAWRERDRGDPALLLAWSAGLEPALATMLIDEGTLEAPVDFEDAANDDNELTIAARITGALPPDQIREIISVARTFGRYDAGCLQKLSNETREHVVKKFDQAAPFQQGEAAARFIREMLGVAADQPVNIFEIATGLKIELKHAWAEPPTLDGLAIWGSRFGPGVFLNESSRRILGSGNTDVTASLGARVTLAHELCHLLLDGGHALSAVEILKARMPAGVEQRAKSFAGEFLLPTQTASRHWQDCGRPVDRTELNTLVEKLVDIYWVTRSVAAWKVEHAAKSNNVDLGAILDSVAPRR